MKRPLSSPRFRATVLPVGMLPVLAVLTLAFSVLPAVLAQSTAQSGEDRYQEYLRLCKATDGVVDDRHVAAIKAAAELGHQVAQAHYGTYLLYKTEPRDPKVVAEAVSWLKKIEDVNKPELIGARFILGLCYISGDGTTRDIKRARALLKVTSADGNADMKMAYAALLLEILNEKKEAKVVLDQISLEDLSSASHAEYKKYQKAVE
ncbi:tetratricopeptide repeat protein [Verrucomicrobium sp. BvORR034]|uniref:tetratricopeptide repeat protein n=1 Tax=Verrucomicrobium sp. BvORR034 TaxID=1396418 RepID=UPI0006788AEF|nr:tetratricopeptide repeat protein [Verrucomicrobium sp. BvORR034]